MLEVCNPCIAKPGDWPSVVLWTVVGVRLWVPLVGYGVGTSIQMQNTGGWTWSQLPRPLGSIALSLLLLSKALSGWSNMVFPSRGGFEIKLWGMSLEVYVMIFFTTLSFIPNWHITKKIKEAEAARAQRAQEEEEEAAAAAAAVNTNEQEIQLAVDESMHAAGGKIDDEPTTSPILGSPESSQQEEDISRPQLIRGELELQKP